MIHRNLTNLKMMASLKTTTRGLAVKEMTLKDLLEAFHYYALEYPEIMCWLVAHKARWRYLDWKVGRLRKKLHAL